MPIPTPENGFDDGTENSVRRFQSGKVTVEIFPEGYILLAREIATGYHPQLEKILSLISETELDEKLLRIALYVGIAVEGEYTIQDRSALAATCSGRLMLLRDLTKGEGTEKIIPYA